MAARWELPRYEQSLEVVQRSGVVELLRAMGVASKIFGVARDSGITAACAKFRERALEISQRFKRGWLHPLPSLRVTVANKPGFIIAASLT